MKNLKTVALALLVVFSTASASAQLKKVNVSKSKITWIGKKVTGEHSGTVDLKEGTLIFKDKKLTGGNFVVAMNTLEATDLKPEDGKTKLDGHLKADDFFGTEKYPLAKLVFKTIAAKANNVYTVTADLTIKDKTNPITFDMTVNGNTATTALKIDRTKYDIKYGSGSFFSNLGDKTINDDFDVNVSLLF